MQRSFAINLTSSDIIGIDQINGYWGKAPINALMLSVAELPGLFGQVLSKDGTSNTAECIVIIQRYEYKSSTVKVQLSV